MRIQTHTHSEKLFWSDHEDFYHILFKRFERGHWIIVFYLRIWILFWWQFFNCQPVELQSIYYHLSFFVSSRFFRLFVCDFYFFRWIHCNFVVCLKMAINFFPCSLDIVYIRYPKNRLPQWIMCKRTKIISNKKGA